MAAKKTARATPAKKKKAAEVDVRLREAFPQARVELDYTTPVELLVATILSAQCTDVKVNEVTQDLFAKYKKPADYLAVEAEELEEDIRQTGFFRQKSKNIRGAMQILLDEHGGEVPGDMDSLVKLPGVGRKTANVILGNVFDIPGVVVDTHMTRVSNRLGLAEGKDAVKIEHAIGALLPPERWIKYSQVAVLHGRYICKARKPNCEECNLIDLCQYFKENAGGQ